VTGDGDQGSKRSARYVRLKSWQYGVRNSPVADNLEEAGDRLFTFTQLPASHWKGAQTINAIERLHEEAKQRIKTQTVPPSSDTATMLFWALLASSQITMRKIDEWQTLVTQPSTDRPLDLAARPDKPHPYRRSRHANSNINSATTT
jgi:transposase-like protein